MRIPRPVKCAVLLAVTLGAGAARAEEPFDACALFTQADAEKALGTPAAAEPAASARHPKTIPDCTYRGVKDGKPVAAAVHFRFARSEAEAQQAFEEARLDLQTKPLILGDADAFWSAKTGQMNLRKGRTWLTVSVGPAKPEERDEESAKKLAEILASKI